MKYSYICFLLILALLSPRLSSQESVLDSLRLELSNSKGEQKVELLFALGEATYRDNNKASIEYFSEAYRLSSKEALKLECLHNMVDLFGSLKNKDSLNFYTDLALGLSSKLHDTLSMMRFNVGKGWNLYALGDYQKAKVYFLKGLNLYTTYMANSANADKLDSYKYSLICNNLGSVYTNLGIYDSAIYYLQIALKEKQKLNIGNRKLGIGFTNLGGVCMRKEDYESALEYVHKGLFYSQEANDTLMIIRALTHLGVCSKNTKDTLQAIDYYKQSVVLSRLIGDQKSSADAFHNLGVIYADRKEWEKSKEYTLKALAINMAVKDKSGIANTFNKLSHHYLKTHSYDSAVVYAQKSLQISQETGEILTSHENYKFLMRAFEGLSDFKEAYRAQQAYMVLHDSLYDLERDERFNELQTKYQTAETEKENLQLNYDLEVEKTQKQRLWWGMAALFLVFGFSAFLVKLKRKKDKLLHEKEQLVLKREKELAKVELEKSQLKEQELKTEVQYKSRQLTTHALNMMQKNTLMQEIQEELVAIAKKANTDNKPALNRIKMLIKKNLRSEKDWDLFKLYFEDVNKQFYEELAKINDELTPNDLKLCALLKLNMNIKESASVMNIEPASVKTARYKLRKKLELQPEDDLVEFIRKIG